ncbi:MAG: 23S rRNA (pseudouridine1915-N3)-methyltransferase [Rhodothermales bacterium]|jgi:23S rRNA (pseudouridine1915-N3)-methyltransferase
MNLRLIFLGKAKPTSLRPAIDEYLGRLKKLTRLEICELRDERIDRRPPELIREKEGERILAALTPSDYVVVCDERGKAVSTDHLVCELRKFREGESAFAGRGRICVVVGGALGVSPAVRQRADAVWSLSGCVLAGSVARLILAEALYRACTVIHGHPYHNA